MPAGENTPLLNGSALQTPKTNGTLSAHAAYQAGDLDASKQYHALKLAGKLPSTEDHSEGGDYLKSMVYGGLDGIMTSFTTLTGAAGGSLTPSIVLILGVAHLFADGLAMGVGDTLSSISENEYIKAETKRERWEMDNNMEGEIGEMVEIFQEKHKLSKEDATSIMEILAKYPDAFLDLMMKEELNLMPVDDDENPMLNGLVTMASFIVFGAVPLLPYLFALFGIHIPDNFKLHIACLLTLFTLFCLGVAKAEVVGTTVGGSQASRYRNWFTSGMTMALNGGLVAVVAYFLAYFVEKLTEQQDIM